MINMCIFYLYEIYNIFSYLVAGNFESRYSCCQGDAESDGCCVSPVSIAD